MVVTSTEAIDRSSLDQKEYRHYFCENGLEVLLLSEPVTGDEGVDDTVDSESENEADDCREDESDGSDCDSGEGDEGECDAGEEKPAASKEKMAALALSVKIGGYDEPANCPGLAHFLEHMIFMGSEKYPKENAFDSYLQKHSGYSNAFTESEMTVFYFDVGQKYLQKAMDILAHSFITPILSKDAVSREVQAVNSEFEAALMSDGARRQQLLYTTAKPGHPIGKFMWGNERSLMTETAAAGLNIYEELKKFCFSNYSSDNMVLTLYSKYPLDCMQEWVCETFALVPRRPVEKAPRPAEPCDPTLFHRYFYMNPVKEVDELEVTWQLPSYISKYLAKPTHQASFLLGHEGAGSLVSLLKEHNFSHTVVAGVDEGNSEHNACWCKFFVTVTLTESGLANREKVLDMIFCYIAMLRESGPQKWIWQEQHLIEESNFMFQEDQEPIEMVETLVSNLYYYPAKHVNSCHDKTWQYQPEMLEEVLTHLRADNCNIMLSSGKLREKFTDKEKWFGTEYGVEVIAAEQEKRWTSITPLAYPQLHLPPPNPYVCSKFELVPLSADQGTTPQLREPQTRYKHWCMLDHKFRAPKGIVKIQLFSNILNETPESRALLDLLANLLEDGGNEDMYLANMASLRCDISTHENAIVINASGYNEKLPLLIERVLERFVAFSHNNHFDAIKELLAKDYQNSCLKPRSLSSQLRLATMCQGALPKIFRLPALADATLKKVEDFHAKLMESGFVVQTYCHGNFTPADTADIAAKVEKILGKSCRDFTPPVDGCLKLPEGTTYLFSPALESSSQDANFSTHLYYQHDKQTLEESCVLQLIDFMLSEPLFNVLRTKEMLGYTVFCERHNTNGTSGLSINVCSQHDKFTYGHVEERVRKFVVEYAEELKKMASDEFNRFKTALLHQKRTDFSNLRDHAQHYYIEIMKQKFMFDRIEVECGLIEATSHKKVVETYTGLMLNSPRCLCIHVLSESETSFASQRKPLTNKVTLLEAPGRKCITDFGATKKELGHLPHVNL